MRQTLDSSVLRSGCRPLMAEGDQMSEYSNEPACEVPGRMPNHAEKLREMVEDAPAFRPEASNDELVAEFADPANRFPAFLTLYSRGAETLPAIRSGFGHANWQVRRWCAMLADNFADAETLHALVPLLRDPKAAVRLWATHSLVCDNCKDGPNPIDAVPLLLERIERDESIRVRRQAVAMLAHYGKPDGRVLLAFRHILANELDRKLLLHAEKGVKRYAEAGLRS